MATPGIDLEIPLGKRSRMYRFFEMVPALISYTMLLGLVVLSIISPLWASIYLLAIIITMIVKAFGMAYHSVVGHRLMVRATRIDWAKRLAQLENPADAYSEIVSRHSRGFDWHVHKENLRFAAADLESFPKPSEVTNVIIITAYNESYDIIQPTFKTLMESTYDMSRVVLVFAYEERGGEGIKQTVERLQKEFGDKFRAFLPIMHPANLPNEVIGKGPNITYAAQQLEPWLRKQKIDDRNVIVTTLDCDNKPHAKYFDYLTYEFIVNENRKHLAFQPVALYFNNIWDAPAPMRVLAIGNSFWTVISSMRPHLLRNFATHSQPMDALREMGYWSKRTIVEDGHQYWRSYFYFGGNYGVVPLHIPVYQDAVLAETFKSTLVAQFKQLRRWAYGASDIPYVAVRLFSRHRNVPFFEGLSRFIRLVDGHVTLATIAILVAIGGWIPLIINPESSQSIAAHNLPNFISYLQRGAMIGLFITIILSLRLLPPRPDRYRRTRTLGMLLQWFLMPFTAIGYGAVSSLVSQTRLMTGRYLDTFDLTEKATKDKVDSDSKSK